MKNHVTSLELSKKLKELGCPQRSEFYWQPEHGREYGAPVITHRLIRADEVEDRPDLEQTMIPYSAYLASELGEMLPESLEGFPDGMSRAYLQIQKKLYYWYVAYWGSRVEMIYEKYTESETEADARAKMLIYLIENSLLKPEDLV